MIKTILFDLDGTLLPMDQEAFTKAYFSRLAGALAPKYEPKKLVSVVLNGVNAMVQNDGKATNEQVFWRVFSDVFGIDALRDRRLFDGFYENGFDGLKECCAFNKRSGETVGRLKAAGYDLVLASNPVFPLIAQQKRVRWAGVDPDDFMYFTSYENSSYCKPNPLYYAQIAQNLGCDTSECLMIGNDATEDMAAQSIGMNVFLLTPGLINSYGKDISVYPRGDLSDLADYIAKL